MLLDGGAATRPDISLGYRIARMGLSLIHIYNKAASFITGVVIPIDGGFSAYSGV